ncbi:uncharacterized protein IUM83_10650 [Phytophthora cinnamomi]|uniref:uncharacterized protein n=1 Tax=Phytophthora cinnamomi TaxID=4785 RepID=UPI0035595309|nr:hypothetical protein IUM83_10650 [Phytophthora cinnamomi]
MAASDSLLSRAERKISGEVSMQPLPSQSPTLHPFVPALSSVARICLSPSGLRCWFTSTCSPCFSPHNLGISRHAE